MQIEWNQCCFAAYSYVSGSYARAKHMLVGWIWPMSPSLPAENPCLEDVRIYHSLEQNYCSVLLLMWLMLHSFYGVPNKSIEISNVTIHTEEVQALVKAWFYLLLWWSHQSEHAYYLRIRLTATYFTHSLLFWLAHRYKAQ